MTIHAIDSGAPAPLSCSRFASSQSPPGRAPSPCPPPRGQAVESAPVRPASARPRSIDCGPPSSSAAAGNGLATGVEKPLRQPPEHETHLVEGFALLGAGRRGALGSLYLCGLVAAAGVSAAYGASPAQILNGYAAQSGSEPIASRGQQFFTARHGREWACATCHGAMPTGKGQHAATGKTIAPLAPAFNPERFTDAAKTEKWFRRNCGDVVGRECTASEKADILSWLMTLRP